MGDRPEDYRARGCQLGCILAVLLYCFPIPVALVVWFFDLRGLLSDYVYMAIPFLLALPFIGWVIGAGIPRKRRQDEFTAYLRQARQRFSEPTPGDSPARSSDVPPESH